ncbi:MAG: hypothetical protein WBV94_13505, partial [Blastocatellia bacterium]
MTDSDSATAQESGELVGPTVQLVIGQRRAFKLNSRGLRATLDYALEQLDDAVVEVEVSPGLIDVKKKVVDLNG